jgi:hypothetical protein
MPYVSTSERMVKRFLLASSLAVLPVIALLVIDPWSPPVPLAKHSALGQERAELIGRQIEAGFPGLQQLRAHGPGKGYSVWSRHPWHPLLTFYEVTAPSEVAAIEALTAKAIAATPEVQAVTLQFIEAEVWYVRPGGGGHRGEENLLKEVTLLSPRKN